MGQQACVAVVGLGAIGGVIAASLEQAGLCEITAYARNPITRLILEEGDVATEVPVRSAATVEQATPADWVLLCTKAYDTPSTYPWLKRLCRVGTKVAVLQNGIDQESRVAPLIGEATVLPSIVYFNGERVSPDRVRFRHAADHDIIVPGTQAGAEFAHLFENTSINIGLSAEFRTLQWRKLLLNAAANPITTLAKQRLSVLRRDDIRQVCLDLLNEGVEVARADGAMLAKNEAAQVFEALLEYSPDVGTSMYFDSLNGRQMEVDALTGAIVAAGSRHGIPTPVNAVLLALLRSINDGVGQSREQI